ncbi:uncharacterized protein B0I36DRAFT_142478 [Microdochium trichocladiopsis]|uniref:Uncharacterized protein n=1 Tax=Microdochium trichocladiopsis TaxID=1682393 RepID=A0A9P9BL54_9PEZI|nr:uncharacterized protein B0I36DRAFT_142478 [Microdochium trichocladiopsis]KAH7027727.1 hypothetical protein B0I36DRAFT_142478 [Microdochium trichocladiopsis]
MFIGKVGVTTLLIVPAEVLADDAGRRSRGFIKIKIKIGKYSQSSHSVTRGYCKARLLYTNGKSSWLQEMCGGNYACPHLPSAAIVHRGQGIGKARIVSSIL